MYVCSKADEMASLVERTAQKQKIRKTKNKTDYILHGKQMLWRTVQLFCARLFAL